MSPKILLTDPIFFVITRRSSLLCDWDPIRRGLVPAVGTTLLRIVTWENPPRTSPGINGHIGAQNGPKGVADLAISERRRLPDRQLAEAIGERDLQGVQRYEQDQGDYSCVMRLGRTRDGTRSPPAHNRQTRGRSIMKDRLHARCWI